MRQTLSLFLAFSLLFVGVPRPAAGAAQEGQPAGRERPSLEELTQRSYLELFQQAPELSLPKNRIEAHREQLEREKEREHDALERQKDRLEEQIDHSQDRLEKLNKGKIQPADVDQTRHRLHCRIQKLRQYLTGTEAALQKGLEIRYDNQFAKLKLLEEWPAEYRNIQQVKETDRKYERKFADYQSIGFRNDTFEDQQDDVERGREAIEELKRRNMLPPEVEDPEVVRYVRSLGQRLARHSDLQVPLHITVLRSEEINAFALPGGFLFINSGLILKAEKESELAGVIAHEIAHAAARHGHRLMQKARIAEILFTAAQIAAVIFTGGIGSLATYYALQYGFYGLGLVLNLQLLGVSRDFEQEADILGTQYLWATGYNPLGFMSFFDKMAQEKGYVTGLSWFRTHPPFYKRMEITFRENMILPDKEEAIDDTQRFHEIKGRLQQVKEEMDREDHEAPSLRRVYECEDVEVDVEVEVEVPVTPPEKAARQTRRRPGTSCAAV